MVFLLVFLTGLYIYLHALNNLIPLESYLEFVTVGYLVVAFLNICGGAGFELIRERNEGKWLYDKTFPIPAYSYAFSRIVGISLRGYVNFILCILLALPFLLQSLSFRGIVTLLLVSAILSVVFTGLSVTPLAFSDNLNLQVALGMILRSWLLFGSNIFYPTSLLPSWLQVITKANPVTWGLGFVRNSIGIPYGMEVSVLEVTLALTGSVGLAVGGGMIAITRFHGRTH